MSTIQPGIQGFTSSSEHGAPYWAPKSRWLVMIYAINMAKKGVVIFHFLTNPTGINMDKHPTHGQSNLHLLLVLGLKSPTKSHVSS